MSLILGEHHTASPDVCRELHEATGWDGTHLHWNTGRRNKMIVTHYSKGIPRYARNGDPEDYCELSETKGEVGHGVLEVTVVPAYDLGYLMRRTPTPVEVLELDHGQWCARPAAGTELIGPQVSTIPEDAVALLCVAMGAAVTTRP